jgi:hypothetical protein
MHDLPARLINTVPFPVFLIEEVMPSCAFAEYKLLCVIVRQTLGWRDPATGQRKESDWMTHAQIKRRTGCASEAISRAIDSLVRKNLIGVLSDTGEILLTSAERRRCAGRLYFRLSETVLAKLTPNPTGEVPVDNWLQMGKTGRITEVGTSESEAATSPTELRKAKTTKDTSYKIYTPYGGSDDTPSEAVPDTRSSKRTSTANPDVRRFLDRYRALFRQHCPGGHQPPIAWTRDGALAKQLLAQYSLDHLTVLLERFFAKTDSWIVRRGYTLGAFRTALPQLLMEDKAPSDHSMRTGRWSKAVGPTVHI